MQNLFTLLRAFKCLHVIQFPFLNFINHLCVKGRQISKNCRNSSILRNKIREFEIEEQKIFEKISFLKQQSLPKKSNAEIECYIKDSLQKLQNLTNSDFIIERDMNQDQMLNVLDIVLTTNLILCNDCPDNYNSCADMNQDEVLNVLDIVTLVNIILS